ncbi:cadherin EGF LAG seven-pass G-type receptor 1 [Microdochium nivale]|nr:cadherin EGF LAG seven-pass G-type receptor 1 [Microdochium nivale]
MEALLRQSAPGNGDRFSPVSSDDHAGYIWIVSIVALVYSLTATIVRVFIKARLFGTDDYLLVASTVLHVAQSIAIFAGLHDGLGKFNSITTPEQWASSGKAYYAANICLFLALSLSKCSILALILRVVQDKTSPMRRLCVGTIGLSAVWGVASIILFSANCPIDSALASGVPSCSAQQVRWIIITAIDVITEIAICVFPLALVWSVHMTSWLKFQVVAAFLFRVPLIGLALVRLTLLNANAASTEPLFAVTNVISVNQVILCWSIISANIPNLKQFLKSFFTGLGYPLNLDDTRVYGSSHAGNNYALRSVTRRTNGRSASASANNTLMTVGGGDMEDSEEAIDRAADMKLRPAGHEHKARVLLHRKDASRDSSNGRRSAARRNRGSGGTADGSDGDGQSRMGSQEMIIRREVEWQVTHEVKI